MVSANDYLPELLNSIDTLGFKNIPMPAFVHFFGETHPP